MELKDIVTASHELDVNYGHNITGVVKTLNEWIWGYEEIQGKIDSTYNVNVFKTWMKENLVEIDEE